MSDLNIEFKIEQLFVKSFCQHSIFHKNILLFIRFFKNGDSLALSQRAIGLYTLSLNASTMQLNAWARHALSQLTATCNPDLYEAFVDVWGTHIITRSLIGGMVEERAKVIRCHRASDDVMFARCIPFRNRQPINSTACAYYAAQARAISRRYLGGNIDLDDEDDWKKTIASGPALLQILEMVPWHDFIRDPAVKRNLQSVIRYRQKMMDILQTEAVRQIDARSLSCNSGINNGARTAVLSLTKSYPRKFLILKNIIHISICPP